MGEREKRKGGRKKAERFSAQITMLVRRPRIGTVWEKEPCAGLTVVPPVKSSDISVRSYFHFGTWTSIRLFFLPHIGMSRSASPIDGSIQLGMLVRRVN